MVTQEAVDERQEELRLISLSMGLGWAINVSGRQDEPPTEVWEIKEILSHSGGARSSEDGCPNQIGLQLRQHTIGRTHERQYIAIPGEAVQLVREWLEALIGAKSYLIEDCPERYELALRTFLNQRLVTVRKVDQDRFLWG